MLMLLYVMKETYLSLEHPSKLTTYKGKNKIDDYS